MTEPEKSDVKPDLKPGRPGPKMYYDGIVAPSFFHEESARAFRAMEMRSDDVVMASPVKAGTTWVHRILYLMLHGLDDQGNAVDSGSMLAKGQVYPDALPLKAPTEPRPTEGPEAFRRNAFGDRGFEDMLAHAAPRLFPTHATARHLPAQLCAPDGTGRLVVVLRNLKDVLVSLHFFYGEPKVAASPALARPAPCILGHFLRAPSSRPIRTAGWATSTARAASIGTSPTRAPMRTARLLIGLPSSTRS